MTANARFTTSVDAAASPSRVNASRDARYAAIDRTPKPTKLSEFEKLIRDIHDSGQAWVEAEFKARQLESDEKPFLASIMNEMEHSDDEKKSEAKLERLAKGSRQYRDYISGMCAARASALRAKVTYESYRDLFEAKRTEAATERTKMGLGI